MGPQMLAGPSAAPRGSSRGRRFQARRLDELPEFDCSRPRVPDQVGGGGERKVTLPFGSRKYADRQQRLGHRKGIARKYGDNGQTVPRWIGRTPRGGREEARHSRTSVAISEDGHGAPGADARQMSTTSGDLSV